MALRGKQQNAAARQGGRRAILDASIGRHVTALKLTLVAAAVLWSKQWMTRQHLWHLLMALVLALSPLTAMPVSAAASHSSMMATCAPAGGPAASMTTACTDCCALPAIAAMLAGRDIGGGTPYLRDIPVPAGIEPALLLPPPRNARP